MLEAGYYDREPLMGNVDAPCGLQVKKRRPRRPFCHDRNEFGVRVEILFSRTQKRVSTLTPNFRD
jgi:hypothetical protein